MINYKNSIQINPRHHYFNIDFNCIKSSLSDWGTSVLDYGSIFVIQTANNFFTVDKLGHITIHYNDITDEEIKSIVVSVNDIFNKFDFVMDYPSDSYLN